MLFILVGGVVVGLEIFAPKLVNMKTALINIEMDVAFFKVRGAGFPNNCVGV